MSRWGVVSSIALVVAANIFVLAGVALDRAGGIVQRVELTQRELRRWTDGDNSGIAVELATWAPQTLKRPPLETPKLVELGFDCSVPPDALCAASHYRKQLARKALMVLEFGGSPQTGSPALMPVDAGRNLTALRAKYADQGRYLIVPGLVRVGLRYDGAKPVAVEGWYFSLQPEIHVPQPYARTLQELRGKGTYHLTLCYGKRLEPWVCGCRP